MENIKVSFGKKVRNLRKSKGLSQEKFANLSNIDRTYIADIENGKRNISITIIKKISDALEISMSELLSGI